nr:hypothetical protein [uncultured Hyphomonas sp.]
MPPRFTSPTSFEFDENTEVFFNLTATDPDSSTLTVTDDASGDGALFKVTLTSDGAYVELNRENRTLDYEAPEDVNGDNVYEQNITLSDGKNTVRTTIRVTILDVDEAPVFTNPVDSIPILPEVALEENFTGVLFTFAAEDPEGAPLSYQFQTPRTRVEGEVNETTRSAISFNDQTGELSIIRPFDYEDEAFAKEFSVEVQVSDGTFTTPAGIFVTLQNVPTQVAEGARIVGVAGQPPFAGSATSLGDIDGDGFDEIWITTTVGAPPYEGAGPAYLVWGKTLKEAMADGPANLSTSDLTSDKAIRFPPPGGTLHYIATTAGDVDRDGKRDILIGYSDPRESYFIPYGEFGTAAFVVFGDALISNSSGEYNPAAPPALAQVALTGVDFWSRADLSIAAGDIDGDGASDVVYGSPLTNFVQVVYGSAINAVRAMGQLDMGFAGPDETLRLSNQVTNPPDKRKGLLGGKVATLPDLDGDGADELLVSGERMVNTDTMDPMTGMSSGTMYQTRLYMLPGRTLVAAKGTNKVELKLEDPANAGDISYFHTDDLYIAGLTTIGDFDADGVPDIAVLHRGKDRSGWWIPSTSLNRIVSVIFGSTAKPMLDTGADMSMDFTDPADGVMIVLNDQTITRLEGWDTAIGVAKSFVDGPGDELLFSLKEDSTPDLRYAGSVYVVKDSAITAAPTAEVAISNEAVDPDIARKLLGFDSSGRIGGYVFGSDLDGDGIADLSLGSASVDALGDDSHTGAYYVLPGTVLQRLFSEDEPTFDLDEALAVEVSGD